MDRAETEAIFKKYNPTYVIHLAAKVGGLFANMAEKVDFYRQNILLNDNIMELLLLTRLSSSESGPRWEGIVVVRLRLSLLKRAV